MSQERVVRFSVRSVLTVIALVVATWALLSLIAITGQVIAWVLVSIFLALALNPAVEWFTRHGIKRRGAAAAVTYLLAIGAIVGLAFLFIPTLVNQINDFVQALPGYVDDVTKGRGRLGFLQTKYHIVDKVREAVSNGGATKVLGLTGTAISITKSVIALVVAIITITFLTFFMLLEGPAWMDTERFVLNAAMPPETTRDQLHSMLQNLLADRLPPRLPGLQGPRWSQEEILVVQRSHRGQAAIGGLLAFLHDPRRVGSSGSRATSSFEPMVGRTLSGVSPGTWRRRAYQSTIASRRAGVPTVWG